MDPSTCISERGPFEALCDALAATPRIAFDMEFVPEDTYYPDLCLLQVATEDHVVAVDLLAVGGPEPFFEAVLIPGKQIVVHAGRGELCACRLHTGHVPQGVFDVQLAAGLVGLGYPLSYERLVGRTLDRRVRTSETRTDWRKRPLTREQVEYALDDVRYLLPLQDHLAREIARRGRERWIESEVQRLLRAVDDENGERFRRVPGAGGLSPRELAVLRELFAWREERAQRLNRPVRRVLRDDLLIECAKRQPQSLEALGRIRGLDGTARSGWARDLVQSVARGAAVPEGECPARHGGRVHPEDQTVLKLLGAMLVHIARENEVAGELLGTNEDLRDLTLWCATGRPEQAKPRLARDWRAEACGDRLIALLEGRVRLSIRQANGAYELAFDE